MQFRVVKFCRNYLLVLLVLLPLMGLAELLPGLAPSPLAVIFLPLLAAATFEGQAYARAMRARPRFCQSCGTACKMTLAAGVCGGGLFLTGAQISPSAIAALGLNPSAESLRGSLLLALLGFVTLRLGYAFGLATELKSQRLLAR
jgi:hypothetical protein